jgi:hypothetical protein
MNFIRDSKTTPIPAVKKRAWAGKGADTSRDSMRPLKVCFRLLGGRSGKRAVLTQIEQHVKMKY